ncbi:MULTISPECIES: hypothetical protein [Paenibacillaceae]|uniref:hypothetical protein n=1 Tax=Paenibacillaceae TaxID=186822 RepID=UPI001561E8C6|nr:MULTISPECIES: hypothetical protein [Brevibacillus]MBE5394933.1 hypothetical protein [Brevibacillus borstelensis]MCG5252933.1 hypothetical protein [Brevibacillus agri]MCM3472218.1 hypothetical protein [Brevibacillus borstelensis]MED1852217.1 hypothetical protein [Brevibacillus borstelensis]WNF05477.1 hypothetical protein RFB14_24625 [Brevibacillus borstelensis]
MIWFLFVLLLFFFLTLRQRKSAYVPNPNGHWVNTGTDYDEQWEWWEPEDNKVLLYVSVLDDDKGYKIVIDDHPPLLGIDYVDCEGKREAETAVSLFTSYYSTFGKVTISDLVGINLNKDMNGG